ncbi:AIR carboxylase family protein, partial [Candidatus Woesearchaeota archaeon]
DEPAFSRVASVLRKAKAVHEVRIASAHRTPELVRKLVAKKWDFIIAGAGVAAALPGVVAAETIRPVFGLPVDSSLDGLDAFLSILQMPPGIPVLTLPPGAAAASWLESNIKFLLSLNSLDGVNFVIPRKSAIASKDLSKRVDKAIELLYSLNVPIMISDAPDRNSVNIAFTDASLKEKHQDALTIYVPVSKTGRKPSPKDAVDLLKKARRDTLLMTGFYRVDNAALAAVELLNANGKYDEGILRQRKEGAKKVAASDREIRKKYSSG